MTSAVDTNVLIALLAGNEAEAEAAQQALGEAAMGGAVIICGAVYAEPMAAPGLSESELDTFLTETDIDVDWSLEEALWRAAGRAYKGYAERRRKQRGDSGPRRILADFIIGAHAAGFADRLLTLDPQLFQANFAELEIMVPRTVQ